MHLPVTLVADVSLQGSVTVNVGTTAPGTTAPGRVEHASPKLRQGLCIHQFLDAQHHRQGKRDTDAADVLVHMDSTFFEASFILQQLPLLQLDISKILAATGACGRGIDRSAERSVEDIAISADLFERRVSDAVDLPDH